MIYSDFNVLNLKFKRFIGKPYFKISVFVFLCLNALCQTECYSETVSHQELLKTVDTITSNAVVNKNHWYPAYHFTSDGAEYLGVSALGFFNDKYHMYYLKSLTMDGKKYSILSHSVSDNLLNWQKLPSVLVPYAYYDQESISNGSIIVDNNLVHVFYTGIGLSAIDSGDDSDNKPKAVATQNLATSKDGLYFGRSANNPVIKSVILKNKHEFSDENFLNPYIWKNNDTFYALVGAQYKKTKDGAVLLYKSQDLRNWEAVNVSAIGQKGEAGYLWEMPAYFNVNGKDVLTISARGIKPHGNLFLNKYQTGAFVGKLDYNTGKFAQNGAFMLYDYGFDFYAPKFLTLEDGRVICIGYLGMEGTEKQEISENWSGMASIPREVKVVNGKLHTIPAKELESLRTDKISVHAVHFNGERDILNAKTSVYELDTSIDLTNAKSFAIKLKYDVSNELVLSYDVDTQILKLDRSNVGGGLDGSREVVLPLYENKLHLRIFSDKSSVEIFANNGPVAMSTRVYPNKNATIIRFVSDGETKVEKLDLYKLKSII